MAGQVDHTNLSTKAARERVGVSKATTGVSGFAWHVIVPGYVALGYRRNHGKPGRWKIRITGAGGVYTYRSAGVADDRLEADGKHVLTFEQAEDAARKLAKAPKIEQMTIERAVGHYLASCEARGVKDLATIESRARRLILPKLGHLLIEGDPKDPGVVSLWKLAAWLDELALAPASYRGGGIRPSDGRARRVSANKARTVLISALKTVRGEVSDRNWIGFAPFKKVNEGRAEYLSRAQQQSFLDHCDAASGFRDLVKAALLTGCRFGELCNLRAGDYHDGKIEIRTSKSGEPRTIDVPHGIDFFEELETRAVAGVLLPNRTHGRAWRKSEQNRPMAAALKAAGLDGLGVSFHSLRHSYASAMVSDGVPLLTVSKLLGHADLRMTTRYSHLAPSVLRDAVAAHAPRFEAPNVVEIAGRRRRHP